MLASLTNGSLMAGATMLGTGINPIPTHDELTSTLLEQMTAAVNLDGVVLNTGRLIGEAMNAPAPDPTFNLFDRLTPDESIVSDDFAFVRSDTELAQVREHRRQEAEWRRQLPSGPLNPFLASILGATADPTTYLSFGVGGLSKAATITARASRAAVATGAEVALGEAVLQAQQQTRTMEESVAAILVGGTLGLGLGGTGAAASKGVQRFAADEFGGIPAGEVAGVREAIGDAQTVIRAAQAEELGDEALGAAEVKLLDPTDSELANSFGVAEFQGKVGRALGGGKTILAPVVELMTSKLDTIRKATTRMSDIGMVTKGVMRGVAGPQPVDIKIRGQQQAMMFELGRGTRMAHKSYKAAGGELDQQAFYEAVGKAVRFPDRFDNPTILKTAEDARNKLFKPLADEAKAVVPGFKTVPEKEGWRYMTRVYRKDRVAADIVDGVSLLNVLRTHFRRTDQAVDDADADAMARSTVNNILSAGSGRSDIILAPPSLRGPTKERVLDIPDELIEPWLESNILVTGARYTRAMAADINFARTFSDLDNPLDPMKSFEKEALEELDTLLEKTPANQRAKLRRAVDAELETLRLLIDKVRGVEPPPLKGLHGVEVGLKIARDVSLARSLGSVVVSSLTDPGRIAMREGVANTFGALFTEFGTAMKGAGIGAREAQKLGGAVDVELNTRAKAMFDVDETHYGQTWLDKASRTSGRMANVFMTATGMPHWNTFWKGVASTAASDRLLRTAERVASGKGVTARERRLMAQSGLDDADMRAFAAEAEHWVEAQGNKLASVQNWGNQAAAQRFGNALLRDIDDSIITPGVGDAPLTWTGNSFVKTVTQFKRFGMAANHRILIAGLQERDSVALGGLASILGLGATVTILKDLVNQGEIRDRTPRQWAGDAIDRSGVLSMYFELEAMMPVNVRPSSYAFERPLSRYADRSLASQIAGPTVGWLEDLGKAVSGVVSDELTQPDLHRVRRIFPFQNHFAISGALTELEKRSGLPARGGGRQASVANLPDPL